MRHPLFIYRRRAAVVVAFLMAFRVAAEQDAAQQRMGTESTQSCRMAGLGTASLELSDQDLFRAYSRQASGIRSLEASAVIRGTSGLEKKDSRRESRPSGAIITFRAPRLFRMTGEVPMSGRRTFDLVSNGREFQLLIPDGAEMHLFEGPVDAPAISQNPRENLRPQPVIDALRWPEAALRSERQEAPDSGASSRTLPLDLRNSDGMAVSAEVSFDLRSGVVREIAFRDSAGKLVLRTEYSEWQLANEGGCYPRHIILEQREQETRLEFRIVSLFLNERISASQFHMVSPPGVRVTRMSSAGATVQHSSVPTAVSGRPRVILPPAQEGLQR